MVATAVAAHFFAGPDKMASRPIGNEAATLTAVLPSGLSTQLRTDKSAALRVTQGQPLDSGATTWSVPFDQTNFFTCVAGANNLNTILTIPRTPGYSASALPTPSRIRIHQTQEVISTAYCYVRGRGADGALKTWQGEFDNEGYLEDQAEDFVSRDGASTTFSSSTAWSSGESAFLYVDEVTVRPFGALSDANPISIEVQVIESTSSGGTVGAWQVMWVQDSLGNHMALTYCPPATLVPTIADPDNSVALGPRVAVDSFSVQVLSAATVSLMYDQQFLEMPKGQSGNQKVLMSRVLPANGTWDEKNLDIQIGGELPAGGEAHEAGWNVVVGKNGTRGYGAVYLQIAPAVQNGTATCRYIGRITFRAIPAPTAADLST